MGTEQLGEENKGSNCLSRRQELLTQTQSNPSKLPCACSQTDSKVFKKRHKPQNNQHNIEGEEQCLTTDTIQL